VIQYHLVRFIKAFAKKAQAFLSFKEIKIAH